MLLPAMGVSLKLSYAEMGTISTVNFCGYLGAVLLCGYFTRLLGSRLLISCALLLVGTSMVAIGFSTRVYLIMGLYFLTGVGSALSNVPIMALIAGWFEPSLRGRAAGLVVMGNGLGIIMAGNLTPILNKMAYGWRLSWLTLGAIAVCVAVICWFLIKNKPADITHEAQAEASQAMKISRAYSDLDTKGSSRLILHCGAIYFLFGFTYVIYATFFVMSLVQERGMTEHEAGALWSWIGLLSLVSGPFFGMISDKYGRRAGLITVFSIQMTAYGMAMTIWPLPFLYISLICFGIVAWSVPTIMAALVGDFVGPEKAAAVFGFITFIFGFGQIAGPFCAGILAETTYGFTASFFLAALFAGIGVMLSAGLPRISSSPAR
jgi:MFS family permease